MSNKKAEAKEQTRHIRTEMARHSVDCSEVIVETSHGVIQLFGKVRALKGHEGAFSAERDALLKGLRQKSGIRDVITNWTIVN